MINLEHIRLLETRITRAIEYVKTVKEENKLLKDRLNSYQDRIEELEVLIQQFKEDQGHIEDGILSALDRLNQFEDAVENVISTEQSNAGKKEHPVTKEHKPANKHAKPEPVVQEASEPAVDSGELEIF